MTPSLRQACTAFQETYARALREHPEDILGLDDLDEAIHEARAHVGRTGMLATLTRAKELANATFRTCSCGGNLTIKARPDIEVHSMQGHAEVEGVALVCDRCHRTVRPLHEWLHVQGVHHTTLLFERLSADFFLDKGSPQAARRLQEHHGLEVGRTTVLKHAEAQAAEARKFLDEKCANAIDAEEKRRTQPARIDEVFTQMDSSSGKTVQPLQRPEDKDVDVSVERTPVRGLVKTTRPIEGRQVKLLCAQGRGQATWSYYAYVGEFDEAITPLQGLAANCGWREGVAAIMTADGDDSIREVAQRAFRPKLQMILDHPHAIEHLGHVTQNAADYLGKPAAKWVEEATNLLHVGRVSELVADVDKIAGQMPVGSKERTKVQNVATYFATRADATHYDTFTERGWPIASGTVEGGHASFIHPLSKRGSGWLVDNLNGATALACVRQNDWWDEFWRWEKRRRAPEKYAAAA
jgi:hypothetical protein